ncbi:MULTISPECIES: site-specific integrase [Bacillus]|uniref:site-specific integrase n=1 Tax=Bacillus TaxID=1386 RepID=UPI0002E8D3D8|nr:MULTISPECIES: site-specific integrase [Bacillus]
MSVRKTSKHSWSFRVDVGKDPTTGKRRQIYRGGFPTKKTAELAKAEFMTKVKNEGFFTPINEIMETFIHRWLYTVYKHEVQSTTFERAESTVKNHILPAFAQSKVNDIKTFDVQQFLSNKAKDGLSPATVKVIKNTLSKAFQTAIDWELTRKNPTERVKCPSIEKKEKETWNPDEVKKFLNACDELRWKVAFSLAIHTGMRRGEILALKWDTINFEEQTIKIVESLAYTKEQGLYFKSPKTTNSIREVVIPASLVSLLKELQHEQKKMKLRMGPAFHHYNLVVSTADGKPIHPRNLARTFTQLINKAGVKRISLHGLRHTNATILMKQGVNPKIVSERLGHANVGITLDIYSHTDLKMQQDTASKLEEILA